MSTASIQNKGVDASATLTLQSHYTIYGCQEGSGSRMWHMGSKAGEIYGRPLCKRSLAGAYEYDAR